MGWLGRALPGPKLPHARQRQKRIFRRQVEDYLEADLKARLGLSNIELFSNQQYSGHHQNLVCESRHGKLFLKIFPRDSAGCAHRTVFYHTLMAEKGLRVPELVCHDTSSDNLERHGFIYVGIKFVQGTLLSADSNADLVRRAFMYLAEVNRVTFDDVDQKLLHEHDSDASSITTSTTGNGEKFGTLLQFEKAHLDTLCNVVTKQNSASRITSPEEADQVNEFLQAGLKTLFAAPQSQVLLHHSFRPRHLIILPDGEMATFDLEGSGFGGFYVDLVKALSNFGYKATSSELDEMEIAELIDAERFDPFLDAYFASAPAEAKKLWQEHRAIILLWGYLELTRTLAHRTVRSIRYGRNKRERTLRQVEQRWQTVVRYVRHASPS
jgi:aminoglycoside phosphotransferase (APT) family kinase protein